MEPDAPWVDAAVHIPYHYVYAHYLAAHGHALLGREQMAERHLARAGWWKNVMGG